ncbi:MAG: hypothetical protein M0R02_15705 [Bacteroidales bacterium]|nr:hypothetical protein [Bacteroidales bacterium]
MANLRIIAADLHGTAALTASSAAMPVANTQNPLRSYPWRSTSAAVQTISATLTASVGGGAGLVLTNTNLRTTATVSAALKDGGVTVNTVSLTCLGSNLDGTTTWHAWFDDTGIDGYTLTLTDTGNPAGYLQVVQILCGEYITTEYNVAYGAGLTLLEDVTAIETAGLSLRTEGTGDVRRVLTVEHEFLLEADRAALIDALVGAGRKATLFVSLYPGEGGAKERDHQFPARRMADLSATHWTSQFWRGREEFREV